MLSNPNRSLRGRRPERLGCAQTDVSDLSPIKGLTSLQNLDFAQTDVSDLSPIKGLTGLWNLD